MPRHNTTSDETTTYFNFMRFSVDKCEKCISIHFKMVLRSKIMLFSDKQVNPALNFIHIVVTPGYMVDKG